MLLQNSLMENLGSGLCVSSPSSAFGSADGVYCLVLLRALFTPRD